MCLKQTEERACSLNHTLIPSSLPRSLSLSLSLSLCLSLSAERRVFSFSHIIQRCSISLSPSMLSIDLSHFSPIFSLSVFLSLSLSLSLSLPLLAQRLSMRATPLRVDKHIPWLRLQGPHLVPLSREVSEMQPGQTQQVCAVASEPSLHTEAWSVCPECLALCPFVSLSP